MPSNVGAAAMADAFGKGLAAVRRQAADLAETFGADPARAVGDAVGRAAQVLGQGIGSVLGATDVQAEASAREAMDRAAAEIVAERDGRGAGADASTGAEAAGDVEGAQGAGAVNGFDRAAAARTATGFSPAADATGGMAGGTRENTVYVRYVKRVFDVAIGLVAMPVLGVLVVVFGPQIKREDDGPIFYNAPRVGKDGKPFLMYKFRSMKVNSPDLVMEDGSTYNGADDPRMTKVGAMMRRTSLDEFPQFLNVLNGTMSVIGPRPDLEREAELYRGDEGDKLKVKPGITGYAAVYGGRNASAWHDRLKLDVYYVHNVDFALDVKIFFKTFEAIFSQEGVYIENEDGVGAAKVAGQDNATAAETTRGERTATVGATAQDVAAGMQDNAAASDAGTTGQDNTGAAETAPRE
jgi:undecaprenyl phosphate N,N'-diacetylbacillosamine 1-phosphate transferase